MRGNGKLYLWITAGITVGLIALVTGFHFLCVFLNAYDEKYMKTYETTDVAEYGDWQNHFKFEMDEANEKLYIFPETVAATDDVTYLYSSKVDSSSYDSGIIFLKIKYDQEAYDKEVSRLS